MSLAKTTPLKLILSSLVALIAGLQLYPFLIWTPEQLAIHGLILDDAYFYTVLAQNFHKFGFLTLDGQMLTNGVQPLWMLVQIILVQLFPNVNTVVLLSRAAWLCYVLFAFLIVWYVTRGSTYTMVLPTLITAGLIVLNVEFQRLVVQGLETPVMLLAVLLTLFAVDLSAGKISADPAAGLAPWHILLLALASSLCFFARTDLFWIPLVTGIWLCFAQRRFWWKPFLFCLIVSALVLPYLTFNYVTQNSLMPISGRVKLFYLDTFHPDLNSYLASDEWRGLFYALTDLLPLSLPIQFRILVTIVAIGGAITLVWRHRNFRTFPVSIQLLGATVVGHLLFMQFFYRELRSYTSYYFAVEILWLAMILALYVAEKAETTGFSSQQLSSLSGWRRNFGLLAVTIGCAVIAVSTWINDTLQPPRYWVQRMNMAHDIRRLVPEHEPIGAFWPGCFAQFSERTVVPLDGIIGSNHYFQNYVKLGKEFDYVAEREIKYLVLYLDASPDTLLSDAKPEIDVWSKLGTKRLWEYRHIPMQVIVSRPVNDRGGGWYLIELQTRRPATLG